MTDPMRDFLQRVQQVGIDAGALLQTLPSPAPTGPPQTYPWLRHDQAVRQPGALAAPAKGTHVVDPISGAMIWRVTDEGGWGTLSAPNQCQVSADDTLFLALNEHGGHRVYEVSTTPRTTWTLLREDVFSVEPTFSRVRPGVLYAAQHGTFQVFEADARTGTRTVLFDVQTDVGPLSQDHGQYMSACYSSRSTRERIAVAYGATQERHPYVTVLEVGNTQNRVTLDVQQSRYKVAGGLWRTLTNYDGTPANLNVGIHSISLDRSGTWVRIDVSGNARHVFFNLRTLRIHQWPQHGGQDTWWGHYAWGDQTIIRAICGPGDRGEYQWILSDMRDPNVPPVFRKLIAQTPSNDQRYDDHPNWNHCPMDGRLVPVLCGTQRANGQTAPWQPYDEEICLVSTEPNPPAEVYRVCHHRSADRGDFYDSPRPQAFHSGRAALFTSHWGGTLPNGQRDLFLVQF